MAALMWFLRASWRVASQTTIFGVGCDILNARTPLNQTERGQDTGRGNTQQEVMELGPCLLADCPGDQAEGTRSTAGDRLKRRVPQTILRLVGRGEAKDTKGQH